MELFEHDYGVDNSPVDNTEICQMILFFSKEETADVKKWAKALMKIYWPGTFIEEGNIYDLFYKLLKEKYEEHYGETQPNGRSSGSVAQRNLFD